MTREEAIEHLEDILRDMWTIDSEVDAINMAIEVLEQPEIIRCKDCKHYRECEIFGKKITLCKRREYDALSVEPDDFCSRAERREG